MPRAVIPLVSVESFFFYSSIYIIKFPYNICVCVWLVCIYINNYINCVWFLFFSFLFIYLCIRFDRLPHKIFHELLLYLCLFCNYANLFICFVSFFFLFFFFFVKIFGFSFFYFLLISLNFLYNLSLHAWCVCVCVGVCWCMFCRVCLYIILVAL